VSKSFAEQLRRFLSSKSAERARFIVSSKNISGNRARTLTANRMLRSLSQITQPGLTSLNARTYVPSWRRFSNERSVQKSSGLASKEVDSVKNRVLEAMRP